MEELNKWIECELLVLRLKKEDWGYLTIEDDSRERTLLDVQQQLKILNIPVVVGRSEQLLAFAQYLHNHSYVNKGFKPETLVRRFKGE